MPKFFPFPFIRHIITQRVYFKMKEETPINRQLFTSKARQQKVDQKKIDFYKAMEQVKEEKDDKIKKVINPNIFKQQIRAQQRDFRQTNHEYLKMCGIISRSSRDENKFNYIGDSNRKTINFSKGNNNAKNAQKKAPLVHLSLETTEFNCSLVNDKIPIKDIYQLFPFRKESIIFQSNQFISSQYIFFFYENQNQVAQNLRNKLEQTIQEAVLAEFKNSINRNFKHIGFFDYLYFVNKKSQKPDIIYPSYMMEIADSNANFLAKIDEDEKEKFNREQISVIQQQTCQRIISCEETDIVDNGQNLCFETIQEYTEYKKYKAINFKTQKIFEKDAIINTNIRNIISTEKIYLVQIIEEVKSYIELSQVCEGSNIMKKVYEQLTSKADQYLRLLCGYTESKILTIYNIENYQEKIYTFIEKSIRFKKEIRNLPQAVIKEFPVLQIWYKLPENLLGYSREQLHDTFYQLMEAIIIFEQKMRLNQFYESLKIKRPGVKYLK